MSHFISCSTLHNISLKGNFTDEKALILLMDAMTAHQTRFGLSPPLAQMTLLTSERSRVYQKKSALGIHLGGLMLEDPRYPLTIEHKPMRMAIAYSSQYSTLSKAVLHRRVASTQSSTLAKSAPNSKKILHTPQHQLPSGPIVCLRVQLMQHMESIYEMAEELSRFLGADPRQLEILSTSEMDETDCCFVILMPLEASEFCQAAYSLQLPLISSRSTSVGLKKGVLERLPSTVVSEPIPSLPSVDTLLQNLIDLSKVSSPVLRKLGIRTIFIQRKNQNGEIISPFHCHIRGGGYGGQGILTEFIPPLFPMASVMENIMDSKDDDIEELPSHEQVNAFNDPNLSRDRSESAAIWYDEDDEDWKEGGSEEKHSQDDIMSHFELPPTSVYEEVTENIDSKLTQSIRALQRGGKIPNEAGAFWQQAFATEQDGEQLIEILDHALDEDGVFHYVSVRKQLCEAMLRRDVASMESIINHIKSHSIPGGLVLNLAEQLLSEVLGLVRDGNNLETIAEGPEQIGIVEDFLMACARIGYSGRETMVAIELREYLVRWALQDNPEYANELPGNLNISRHNICRDQTKSFGFKCHDFS
jgi:hypothetical protein